MCTRLQALGFSSARDGSADRLVAGLASSASRTVVCSRGEYRVWRSQSGAELWFHYPRASESGSGQQPNFLDNGDAGKARALTPFYRGSSEILIRVDRAVSNEKNNPLEGSFRATLRAPESIGVLPQLRLEMVPFALQRRSRRPFLAKTQIVAFAYDVWAFETVAAYEQETPPARMIPAGAMSSASEPDIYGSSRPAGERDPYLGLATGVVKRTVRLVNAASGLPFYWLLLETAAGEIDVVTAPGSVRGDISEGHVAQICGSFVGQLKDSANY